MSFTSTEGHPVRLGYADETEHAAVTSGIGSSSLRSFPMFAFTVGERGDDGVVAQGVVLTTSIFESGEAAVEAGSNEPSFWMLEEGALQ